jgi:hypothetical protein
MKGIIVSKIKENKSSLGIINLGYKNQKVCIVLNKSKQFHEYYNVFIERNCYCVHKKNIKFI